MKHRGNISYIVATNTTREQHMKHRGNISYVWSQIRLSEWPM